MTIELSDEEVKLVQRCLQEQMVHHFNNIFDEELQKAGLRERNEQLYNQYKELFEKITRMKEMVINK